jgi:hypothetical protein
MPKKAAKKGNKAGELEFDANFESGNIGQVRRGAVSPQSGEAGFRMRCTSSPLLATGDQTERRGV